MEPDGLTRHSRVGVLGAALYRPSPAHDDRWLRSRAAAMRRCRGALPAPRTSPLLAVRGIASGLPGALDEVGGRNAHSHVNTRDDRFFPLARCRGTRVHTVSVWTPGGLAHQP